MFTSGGRVQIWKGWALSLGILIATFCVALADTTHLLSIVPYLVAVAVILGQAAFSNAQTSMAVGVEHGQLVCSVGSSRDSFEINVACIDPAEFYPFWNDGLPGRLKR